MDVILILCLTLVLLLLTIFCIVRSLSWELPSFQVIYRTFWRDLRAGMVFARILSYTYMCYIRNLTVAQRFESVVKNHRQKTCFIFEDKEWTFQQVEDYSNQVASYFARAGYSKGEEVAIFLENRPEFVGLWLGLSKIGVIPALINTNLKMYSLAHCVNAVSIKAIIFSEEYKAAAQDAFSLLNNKEIIECYCLGDTTCTDSSKLVIKPLNELIKQSPKDPLDKGKYSFGFHDKLFYIYTSGTTGLPKAAIVRHSRFHMVAAGLKYGMGIYQDDIIYNTLPLYHSAGGMLHVAGSISFGNTTVIKKKFSASNFWKDAIKYKATVSGYIGELCRFLLNRPPSPEETQHSIRLMCGNGLRPQIWKEFQDRFKITKIVELYGATEGIANILNIFGVPGSVGFISRIFSRAFPVSLIKVDEETGEPIRNDSGLCIRCKPGEPGGIVGRMTRMGPIFEFDGYVNRSETQKKIITDCFAKGDQAFLSGDILVMDRDGNMYFTDRLGDTFRWRGENVATNEVEAIISKILGLISCVVYGVAIPGVEGRAGMAAIQSDVMPDLDALLKGFLTSLPSYAIPIFIRICQSLQFTGTYKIKKVDLQKEGYNVEEIADPIFFLEPTRCSYIRLDLNTYNQINEGKLRL